MPMLPILLATLVAIMSVWAIVYSLRLYTPAFRAILRELANGGAAINYRFAIKPSHITLSPVVGAIRIADLPYRRMKCSNGLRYSTAALAKAA